MGWINSDPDRQVIEVRSQMLNTNAYGRIAIDDLMDGIEAFTENADPSNEIYLDACDNPTLRETRYETDEELSARLEEARQHALSVQRKADKSWERQKRKFQRARNKKK